MEAFQNKQRDSSRSRSRGREPLVSTGRGGSGNIRTPSQGGQMSVDDGVTQPVERGRHIDAPTPSHQVHSGRGGAGNIRSPSRDPADKERIKNEDALEAQLIREKRAAEAGEPRMSGRGGWGNISSRSRSREPTGKDGSPAPAHGHSSGRGGAGNHFEGKPDDASSLSTLDESDRSVRESYDAKRGTNGVTSTGKGGAGNMHAVSGMAHEDRGTAPHAEPAHGHTSGRGGAGNYVPPPSDGTTPPDSRGRSPHDGNGNGHRGPLEAVKDMVRGLSRSKSRDRTKD